MAGASSAPWDGSAGRFSIEQWRRSCCIDHGGDSSEKGNYSLPIREPDGTLNRNGVHNAAARINQVQCSSSAKAAGARKLAAAYRSMGEHPPADVLRFAGESAAETVAHHLRPSRDDSRS